jgi:Protein of unknown function (DUF4058)
MPYPFPGMNPYLEQPAFWSSVHSRLIVAIADAVAPQILPNYYIEVETRTYSEDPSNELLIGIPDAVVLTQSGMARSLPTTATALQTRPQQVQLPIGLEVKDRYLEVRETGTNAVVTVIELLSPKNKRAGKGRSSDEAKRDRILESMAHLVEIDLLRIADPMPLQNDFSWDYRILVSRSEARPNADLYGFTLRERIPNFPLPLKQPEEFVMVDLQSILQGVYDRAGYDYRIDYQQPIPPPSLTAEDQAWITQILAINSIAP